jgi:hypothetical protein
MCSDAIRSLPSGKMNVVNDIAQLEILREMRKLCKKNGVDATPIIFTLDNTLLQQATAYDDIKCINPRFGNVFNWK